jgi:hypothetical protein
MEDRQEIEKNVLDLKYQDRISRRNIFLGSIIPFSLGILSLGGVRSALTMKLVLISYGSLILFQLSRAERDKCEEIISEIRELSVLGGRNEETKES